jgi:hypothetical protein
MFLCYWYCISEILFSKTSHDWGKVNLENSFSSNRCNPWWVFGLLKFGELDTLNHVFGSE